jgi:hypothetical protein
MAAKLEHRCQNKTQQVQTCMYARECKAGGAEIATQKSEHFNKTSLLI